MPPRTVLITFFQPTAPLCDILADFVAKMDSSNECHVVRILRDYGDSILDGTFLSRIQGNLLNDLSYGMELFTDPYMCNFTEDTGIRADQPLGRMDAAHDKFDSQKC